MSIDDLTLDTVKRKYASEIDRISTLETHGVSEQESRGVSGS